MKTTSTSADTKVLLRESLSNEQIAELMADDILPECKIEYSKAWPNGFTRRENVTELIRLDTDVAAVFQTAESVSTALRALIQAAPQTTHEA